jgi:hypothetical protein
VVRSLQEKYIEGFEIFRQLGLDPNGEEKKFDIDVYN